MNKIPIYKMSQLQLNSIDRDNIVDDPGYCSITYDVPVNGTWELSYALFVNSAYNINHTNNNFTIVESYNTYSVCIPVGSYTNIDIVTALQLGFNNSGSPAVYTVAIIDGLISISTLSTSFTLQFASHNNLWYILGFNLKTIESNPYNVIAYRSVNVNWNRTWTLFINDVPTNLQISGTRNATFSIGVTAAYQGLQEYIPRGRKQYVTLNSSQQRIKVMILDDSENIVDFMGHDWVIILQKNG